MIPAVEGHSKYKYTKIIFMKYSHKNQNTLPTSTDNCDVGTALALFFVHKHTDDLILDLCYLT